LNSTIASYEATVESKPKRFQVAISQSLYDVFDALSDVDGYDSPKTLTTDLIQQYCMSRLMEIRDDRESDFYQCWTEMFEGDLDDEVISRICQL
jgi:hypothetical protein